MNACLIDVLFSSTVVVARFRNWGCTALMQGWKFILLILCFIAF
ncbi:hypothetical protein HanIR_Chr13g0619321 [Helianthus annuus]|nr:hypothetical protein HanIR_Chr13g0619321 [Helianthus annuus]